MGRLSGVRQRYDPNAVMFSGLALQRSHRPHPPRPQRPGLVT
ncbi:MAG TPA: hypothetical protein VKG81_16295 [Mycobacterium sp.]|nr:hypothetical protein [Mycobacterium sp.]HME49588.1 hypothetical protein [Mycobacterium sp.]